MKLVKSKVQGIMEVEVRFTANEDVPGYDRFEIRSVSNGIFFTGRSPLLASHDDLQELAKAIGEAMKEHLALKKCKGIQVME